jgi:hypothetical protein
MGRAIVTSVALVIIVAIIAFVIRKSLKESNQVGDWNLKQEREARQLLTEAAHVMRGIGPGLEIHDSDVISDRSRRAINNWLTRYEDNKTKEINA